MSYSSRKLTLFKAYSLEKMLPGFSWFSSFHLYNLNVKPYQVFLFVRKAGVYKLILRGTARQKAKLSMTRSTEKESPAWHFRLSSPIIAGNWPILFSTNKIVKEEWRAAYFDGFTISGISRGFGGFQKSKADGYVRVPKTLTPFFSASCIWHIKRGKVSLTVMAAIFILFYFEPLVRFSQQYLKVQQWSKRRCIHIKE